MILAWISGVLLALPVGCKKPEKQRPAQGPVEDIALDFVGPRTLLPGTAMVLEGENFLPEIAGPTTLTLSGELGRERASARLPVTFIDYGRMEAVWPGSTALGGEGALQGWVRLSTESAYDGRRHLSEKLEGDFEIADRLVPVLEAVEDAGRHVNDRILLRGEGMLLGGGEGQTLALVSGCFAKGSGPCRPVEPVEIPTTPTLPLARSAVTFPFAPEIAGVEPGRFEGSVQLVNRHADGTETRSEALPLEHVIEPPFLADFSPKEASLGQIVTIEGGGFVGPGPGDGAATTLLELEGRFSAPGEPGFDIVLTLVGTMVEGDRLHYVLNEEDALGRLVDVRTSRGSFQGTARPIVAFQDSTIEGEAVPVELTLQPVKQVVWLKFLPSFVESLRQFGLRSARDAVIERIVEVVERDYEGINLEIRLEQPTDFALYSIVELSGPDPNGLGLLGYDNTPGKDVGNARLYDTLGGVNALTQQDGYPGYGGVFIDSLFAFSEHPPGRDAGEGLAEPAFDALFDPVRPDVDGGERVSEEEAQDLLRIEDNDACPARGRRRQVACAVFAMGNLVGTTLSHEIAHSLGLADPDGPSFHNTGDWTNALMDSGSNRPFSERAEIEGEGPGTFCQGDYAYLREILPTYRPDPLEQRPECY